MALPSIRVSELRRREHYPNLMAAWGFGEGAGTTARDSSDNSLPLTVDVGLTWPAGHSGGFAIKNTGAGSAYRSWNLGSPITVMAWARPLDLTAGTNRAIFGLWDTTDTLGTTQFAVWAQRGDFSTSNVLQGNVRIDGNLTPINHTALTLNTWVHVALSYDGSNVRLFRDGVEVATVANAGTMSSGTFFFSVVPDTTNAEADDVRIFSTALNAAQITALMNDPVAAP